MTDNQTLKDDVYFPKQEDFEFLLIKPYDTSKFRHDDPDYKHFICNLDIYKTIKTSSDKFFNDISNAMDLKFMEKRNKPYALNTQIVWETYDHIYELIEITLMPDDLPVEIYNGVSNILKTDYQHVFGNSVMIKTKIDADSDEMKMVNCGVKDLDELLENRVRHRGVRVDDDYDTDEITWYYNDPSKMIDDFMTKEFIFVEKIFLLHNLQIYYTKGDKMDFEKIIGCGYDQLIILTKITDEFYGNFTIKEFNQMKKLLEPSCKCPIVCPDEWKEPSEELKKQLDETKQKYIFNKYRALSKAIKLYT